MALPLAVGVTAVSGNYREDFRGHGIIRPACAGINTDIYHIKNWRCRHFSPSQGHNIATSPTRICFQENKGSVHLKESDWVPILAFGA